MSVDKTESGKAPQLSAVQRWMQQILIQPLGEGDAKPWQHLPEHLHQAPVDNLIVATDKLSARGHLHIYQSSYILRLRDCMAKQFSALEFALGKQVFQHFADQYLQTYPSSSHTLSDLGKNFSRYLQETRPDGDSDEKESWPDFLIELADYEYAVNVLFDLQAEPDDRDVIEADENTPEDDLQLRPVFQLFQHNYPIAAYYRAVLADQAPELPFPEQNFSVLLRRNYRLGIFDLSATHFYFLKLWQELGDLAETRVQFAQAHGFSESKLAEAWQVWRSLWLGQGFLVASDG